MRLSPTELQRLLPPKELQKQFPQLAEALPPLADDDEQPLSEKEWRENLHAARGKFPATPGGLTKQGARQAYREAFLLTVAKQGRQAALDFRRRLLASRQEVGDQAVAPEERGDEALDQIERLGGNKALRKAHYAADPVNELARVRQEQIENRREWEAYGAALEGQLMAPRGLKDEFLARNAFERDRGYPIPDETRQRWRGVANYEAAVDELSMRVRESRDHRGLDPISELHKRDTVAAQREAFKDKHGPMPSGMLIYGGRLNQAETRRVLEPWWQAQKEAFAVNPHRVDKPPAFERVMAREEGLIAFEATLIGTDGSFETKDAWPIDLFSGRDQDDGLWNHLHTLNQEQLGRRQKVPGDQQQTDRRTARLSQARGLAELGLRLRKEKVPAKQVAEILRMELEQRIAGNGPDQPDQVSPALRSSRGAHTVSQEARGTARTRLQAKRNIAGQHGTRLGIESAKRIDEARLYGALFGVNADELLANNGRGLRAAIDAGVGVRDVLDLMQRGANDYAEAISCDRLGVRPEDLNTLDADTMRQWTGAGFNRAEAVAYSGAGLAPTDRVLRHFRGSRMTPSQIALWRRLGLGRSRDTRPHRFIDRNREGGLQRLDRGLYLATYRTTAGVEQRRLMAARDPAEHDERLRPVGQTGVFQAALAARVVDAFDVIVPTEVGEAGGEPVLATPHMPVTAAVLADIAHPQRTVLDREAQADLYAHPHITEDTDEGERARREASRALDHGSIALDEGGNLVAIRSVLAALQRDPTYQRKKVALRIDDYLFDIRGRRPEDMAVRVTQDGRCEDVRGINNHRAFGSSPGISAAQAAMMGLHPLERDQPPELPMVIDTDQRRRITNLHNTYFAADVNHPDQPSMLKQRMSALLPTEQLHRFEQRRRTLHTWSQGQTAIQPNQWGTEAVTGLLAPPAPHDA